MTLSFADALRGAQLTIPVEKPVTCSTCNGSGAQPGTSPTICPGVPRPRHQEPQPGPVLAAGAVRPLRRRRHRDRVPCPTCHGQGRVRQTKRYHVKVPPGVKDGAKIRLKGKGEAGVRAASPATSTSSRT